MRKAEREMLRHVLKTAQSNRKNAFDVLRQQGHVTVMTDEQPDVIRVRVDGEFFSDSRKDFPTAGLMARLQLAISAGQSDRNHPRLGDSHVGDMQASLRRFRQEREVTFMEEVYDYKTGGDLLHGGVTATVTKFSKGLRP